MTDRWEDYDTYQKHLQMVSCEIESIIRCCKHYENLITNFYKNLDIINISSIFFGEVLDAFKYKIYVGATKIFDNRSDANFIKLLQKNELTGNYYEKIKDIETEVNRKLKNEYSDIMKILSNDRNRYYAHLNKNFFDGTIYDSLFENENFERLKEMLYWSWDILVKIGEKFNIGIPNRTYVVDLDKLIERIK